MHRAKHYCIGIFVKPDTGIALWGHTWRLLAILMKKVFSIFLILFAFVFIPSCGLFMTQDFIFECTKYSSSKQVGVHCNNGKDIYDKWDYTSCIPYNGIEHFWCTKQ